MKKLIGILVAALMIIQSGAVFAADYNTSVTVDGSLGVRDSGGTSREYSETVSITGTEGTVDYQATLDLSAVRDAFTAYVAAAKAAGKWTDTQLSSAPVSGTFTITVNFDSNLKVPETFSSATDLVGFSENAQKAFTETAARVVTATETGTQVVITIGVKDGVTVSDIEKSIDTYLPDMTLTVEYVGAAQAGTFSAGGAITGTVTTAVDSDNLTVAIASAADSIAADVTVTEGTYEINTVDVSVTTPTKNATPSTTVTVPENAPYTSSDITWTNSKTGASVSKFTAGNKYDATFTLTAVNGTQFTESDVDELKVLFDDEEASNVTVTLSDDKSTATVTRTYSIASGGSGGGGGGGGSLTTSATATPAPTATADATATEAPSTVTSNPTTTTTFTDVPATYWAYSYIEDLYQAGVVNGATDTTFLPDNEINRAEFAKMAVVLFDLQNVSTESKFFEDCPSDAWFTPYVIAGTEAGIILGTSETTYSPYDPVTREQMAAIIGRYFDMTSNAALSYADADSIEAYALPYVTALTENGLLTGDNGYFRPADSSTRAEAATLLDRVMNNLLGGQPVGQPSGADAGNE